jgi:hypothetical protein
MSVNGKNRMWVFIGLALVAVALVMMNRSHSAQEERGAASSGPRYTVVETQGFNLLVTDNSTNKLYFYATDKEAPVGSPMKLRASLDLSQIGKPELKPTHHNLENVRPKEEK